MANLGLINKNPGNLKDPATGKFEVFKDSQEGYKALVSDLEFKKSGKSPHIKPGQSLSQLAAVWAPSSDNNNPNDWANNVARTTGTTPDVAWDSIPTDKLAKGIQVAEGTSTMNETPSNPIQVSNSSSFAQKIKAKYPQYADIPDDELVQKILKKYPQYADMVGLSDNQNTQAPSVSQKEQTIKEEPKRGVLSSIAHGIINPIATTAARPIQAIAELSGASAENVDKFSKEKLGGFVDPVPKGGQDLPKEALNLAETLAAVYGVAKVPGLLNSLKAAPSLPSSIVKQLGGKQVIDKMTATETYNAIKALKSGADASTIDAIEKATMKILPSYMKENPDVFNLLQRHPILAEILKNSWKGTKGAAKWGAGLFFGKELLSGINPQK